MYMFRLLFLVLVVALAYVPAQAQETNEEVQYGKDRFLSGSTVIQDKEGVDDLFMVGETVRNEKAITGSAHMAGRNVVSDGEIGGDAYMAGMHVTVNGKVDGDATLSGYSVSAKEVDGDIRASGRKVTLAGPVTGYALLAGDEVKIDSLVKGDVAVSADKVEFGDNAKIDGKLTLYADKADKIDVPASVISADRVERRDRSEWSKDELGKDNRKNPVASFLRKVLFFTVMAVLIAAIRPEKLADLRRNILARPFQNLLFGFLVVAAGIGAAILLIFTGLGFLLVLASLMIALMMAFTGYVVGTYAMGVGLFQLVKWPEPDSLRTRVFAAVVGAFAVAIIAMIPYLGGLFVLALALTGGGAIAARLYQPKRVAAG